jgi:hypothetical protein
MPDQQALTRSLREALHWSAIDFLGPRLLVMSIAPQIGRGQHSTGDIFAESGTVIGDDLAEATRRTSELARGPTQSGAKATEILGILTDATFKLGATLTYGGRPVRGFDARRLLWQGIGSEWLKGAGNG